MNVFFFLFPKEMVMGSMFCWVAILNTAYCDDTATLTFTFMCFFTELSCPLSIFLNFSSLYLFLILTGIVSWPIFPAYLLVLGLYPLCFLAYPVKGFTSIICFVPRVTWFLFGNYFFLLHVFSILPDLSEDISET